ncbi:MAG TPA: restriction endonuclease subunit R, partial [bacterium]
LNDPAYFEKMSTLLDEIISTRKAKAIEYAAYLRKIAELAKQVEAGHEEDTPEVLKNSPAMRAIYNNLKQDVDKDRGGERLHGNIAYSDFDLDLAKKIDEAVKTTRPDGWRGVQAREQVIKRALFDVLNDVNAVERLFPIIKAQREY